MNAFIFSFAAIVIYAFPLYQIQAKELETSFEIFCKGLDNYLLPDNHFIKEPLDRIFSSSRVLASIDAMKEAGFIDPVVRPRGIVIGKHPELQGYLLKMYLDTSSIDELSKFTKRIKGAHLIQKTIDSKGYNHILKVPQKWIYQLPSEPSPVPGFDKYPKKYVLVVEDMHLVKHAINEHFYRHLIAPDQLEALFKVLITCGLQDSTHILNIPVSTDRKISFIDTEITGKIMGAWFKIPVMLNFLSPENQVHWRNLMKEGVLKTNEQ